MVGTVLTVLRSGGEYKPAHVERLRDQVAQFSDAEFRCLSDVDVPGRIEMQEAWPGWWCKIEALRLPGPILYMDLDTTVRGDLSPMLAAAKRGFVTLRDFLHPRVPRTVGSGVMAWAGDMSALYHEFKTDPQGYMAKCKTRQWFGDQGFIEMKGPKPEFWQDILPGAVVSHKLHCKQGVPADARIVAFHGRPRPWEIGQ